MCVDLPNSSVSRQALLADTTLILPSTSESCEGASDACDSDRSEFGSDAPIRQNVLQSICSEIAIIVGLAAIMRRNIID